MFSVFLKKIATVNIPIINLSTHFVIHGEESALTILFFDIRNQCAVVFQELGIWAEISVKLDMGKKERQVVR